jgi:hypothetical protein
LEWSYCLRHSFLHTRTQDLSIRINDEEKRDQRSESKPNRPRQTRKKMTHPVDRHCIPTLAPALFWWYNSASKSNI